MRHTIDSLLPSLCTSASIVTAESSPSTDEMRFISGLRSLMNLTTEFATQQCGIMYGSGNGSTLPCVQLECDELSLSAYLVEINIEKLLHWFRTANSERTEARVDVINGKY